MVDDPHPFGPIDLDALDEYLLADHSPDNCMGLSGFDEFLRVAEPQKDHRGGFDDRC